MSTSEATAPEDEEGNQGDDDDFKKMLDTKTGDPKLIIADEVSEKSGMLIFFIFIA